MKKIIVILALAAVGALAYTMYGTTHTVRLTQAELEDHLRRRMPVTHRAARVIDMSLENASVRLEPGSDRVGIDVDVLLSIRMGGPRVSWNGRLEGDAALRYEAEKGEVFLRDPRVTRFVLDGLPEHQVALATEAAQVALAVALQDHPVYVLSEHGMGFMATRRVLEDVRVEDGALVLVLVLRM